MIAALNLSPSGLSSKLPAPSRRLPESHGQPCQPQLSSQCGLLRASQSKLGFAALAICRRECLSSLRSLVRTQGPLLGPLLENWVCGWRGRKFRCARDTTFTRQSGIVPRPSSQMGAQGAALSFRVSGPGSLSKALHSQQSKQGPGVQETVRLCQGRRPFQ